MKSTASQVQEMVGEGVRYMSSEIWTLVVLAGALLLYRFLVSPLVKLTSRRASMPVGRFSVVVAIWMFLAVILHLGGAADPLDDFRLVIMVAMAAVTWKTVTADWNFSEQRRPQVIYRLGLFFLLVLSLIDLPVAVLWLMWLVSTGKPWVHHSMLAIRLVKMYTAVAILLFVLDLIVPTDSEQASPLLLLFAGIALSHYVKPAFSKIVLGRRPWSWVVENQPYALAASAYMWGWRRLPEPLTIHLLRMTAKLSIPLNAAALAVELLPLVSGFSPRMLGFSLAICAFFNIVVVILSGIFFWENILCLGALSATAFILEDQWVPSWWMAISFAALLLLSSGHLTWKPWDLGWWDTPFAVRMIWIVLTEDGGKFELHNNFLDPYERDYGRHYGYFLCDERICTFHLGGVFDSTLRDALFESAGAPREVENIKEVYGASQRNDEQRDSHDRFMIDLFMALNAGSRRGPLAGACRVLKAPGGQLFYRGNLAPYRGGKVVTEVTVRYRETYFDVGEGAFTTITDQLVHRTPIMDRSNGHR